MRKRPACSIWAMICSDTRRACRASAADALMCGINARARAISSSAVGGATVCATLIRDSGLDQPHPAIDHEVLPGDIIGAGRSEKRGGADQIVGGRNAAQDRLGLGEMIDRVGLVAIAGRDQILVEAVPERRLDKARTETVDGDVVFAERLGAGLREGNDASFAGAIDGGDLLADLADYRGGVDNLAAAALRDHLLRRLLHADQHAEA